MAYSFDVFRQFADKPGSPFYCSPGRTPQETWEAIYRMLEHTIAEAAYRHRAGALEITPDELHEWHRRIFVDTFPGDAGRVRGWDASGEPELVSFGIEIGTVKTRHVKEARGTHPERLADRLTEIFDQFHATVESLARNEGRRVEDAVAAAAKLYARVLSAHPYVDGNLRAGFVTLQSALLWLGLPMVDFPDLAAHDEALGFALRVDGKQSYARLTQLVTDRYQASGALRR